MRKITKILKKLKQLKIERNHFLNQLKSLKNSDSPSVPAGTSFYKRRISEAEKQISILKWVLKIKKK